MKIAYINPNATESMTSGIVENARLAIPDMEIIGLTNTNGPVAIEGAADGAAAVPGLLERVSEAIAQGADAIVIGCFDDTGLSEARAQAPCPVLGIGQASFMMASLLGLRFSVVTSVAAAIPVIETNIREQGFDYLRASVRASGLPVLMIDEGRPETIDRLVAEIDAAQSEDNAGCVILGCAGMAPLKTVLDQRTSLPLIDGVAASAHLARASVACLKDGVSLKDGLGGEVC